MTHEFHYRLGGRHDGLRPGAHLGRSEGTGQLFTSHRRLLDHPDPRRLDVRASLRDIRGDWLVRLARPRVAVPIHVIVDVSASMHVGAPRRKLDLVADFVESLGLSAFRAGDPLGMVAFDGLHAQARDDLHRPPRRGRGVGADLAASLRALPLPDTDARKPLTAEGLLDAAQRLGSARRDALVFIASDFHGAPIEALDRVLDTLWPAQVVPLLVWHAHETAPPSGRGLLAVDDAETGQRRSLWLRPALRERWRSAVDERRAALARVFARRDSPVHALVANARGGFDAEAMTRYFQEQRP